MKQKAKQQVLITGATGYVGGRLLKYLEKKPLSLRCMARRPQYLRSEVQSSTEVVMGDVLEVDLLRNALFGTHTAYYLIHALGSSQDFETQDYQGAKNFAQAAKDAGVKKIIYLGGLGSKQKKLSKHLRSRHHVGEILRSSGIPVLEFRASIILGSGSLSFEMVRALVERLPLMTTPAWVSTPAQPIAIEDVISYLVEALDLELKESKMFEIGGADQVSYGGIMKEYARQRGLRRVLIPIPVLTPKVSSLWLSLVTPIYAKVGKKLIEGIRNPTLVQDSSALQTFSVRPMGIQRAIERALKNEDQDFAQTHWSDALSSVDEKSWGGVRFKNRIVDSRAISVKAKAEQAFAPIMRIGGENGWYYANFLWRTRGFIDRLFHGVGLRRGRRDPTHLLPGDALDFWRVEEIRVPKKLLLLAEMKLPGRAWLEFEVEEKESKSEIRQTAIFDPVGIGGILYWYLLYPIHHLIFMGMLREIGKRAH